MTIIDKEQYEKLFKRLIFDNKNGIPILVEGKNDVKKLRELGVVGHVYVLKGSGDPIYKIVEEAINQAHKVIILTDVDQAGTKLAKKVAEIVSGLGYHADLRYRKLIRLARRDEVEHLPSKID